MKVGWTVNVFGLALWTRSAESVFMCYWAQSGVLSNVKKIFKFDNPPSYDTICAALITVKLPPT